MNILSRLENKINLRLHLPYLQNGRNYKERKPLLWLKIFKVHLPGGGWIIAEDQIRLFFVV